MMQSIATVIGSAVVAVIAVQFISPSVPPESPRPGGGENGALMSRLDSQDREISALKNRLQELEHEAPAAATIAGSETLATVKTQEDLEKVVARVVEDKKEEWGLQPSSVPAMSMENPVAIDATMVSQVEKKLQQRQQERHVSRLIEGIQERLYKDLDLQDWQKEKLDEVMSSYFTASSAFWFQQDLPREERRAATDKLKAERDAAAQDILDAGQYEKYTKSMGDLSRRWGGSRQRNRDRHNNDDKKADTDNTSR